MTPILYTLAMTLLIVAWTFYLSLRVGLYRGVVKAPAVTGNEEFERAFRIHYNTNEQIILFLPCYWLALPVWGDMVSGIVGAIWLAGRIVYATAYQKDPGTRRNGMIITILALLAAFIAAAVRVVNMAL